MQARGTAWQFDGRLAVAAAVNSVVSLSCKKCLIALHPGAPPRGAAARPVRACTCKYQADMLLWLACSLCCQHREQCCADQYLAGRRTPSSPGGAAGACMAPGSVGTGGGGPGAAGGCTGGAPPVLFFFFVNLGYMPDIHRPPGQPAQRANSNKSLKNVVRLS
jgi:hypothetical protein